MADKQQTQANQPNTQRSDPDVDTKTSGVGLAGADTSDTDVTKGTASGRKRPDVADASTTASRVVGAGIAGTGTAGNGNVGSGVAGSDIMGTNAAGTDVTEADVTGAGIAGQGVGGSAASGTDEMGSNIQGTNEISDQIGGKAAHDLVDMQERARGAVPGVPPLESRKTRP